MENLESQITSLDQKLNLALVEKINKEIKDIKVRLDNLENYQENLSEDEKEWLNVFKK